MKKTLLMAVVGWMLVPALAWGESLINENSKEGKILLEIVAIEKDIAKAKNRTEFEIEKEYATAAAFALYKVNCIKNIDKKNADHLSGYADLFFLVGTEFSNEQHFSEVLRSEHASINNIGAGCADNE